MKTLLLSVSLLLPVSLAAPRGRRTSARAAPTLGAFSSPATINGVVSGTPFQWVGTVTLTPNPSESQRTISGVGAFTLIVPPPPLALSYLSMAPGSVLAGQSATVTVVLNRAPGVAVQIPLKSSDTSIATVADSLTLQPTQTQGTAVVVSKSVATLRVVAITATLNGQSRGANLQVNPIITPPPPPPPPAVTGILDSFRVPITSANAGAMVLITGSNLGTSGTVTFAGLPLIVPLWSATEIKGALPSVSADTTAPLIVTPTGKPAIASAPFMITFVGPPPPPPDMLPSGAVFAADGVTPLTHGLPGTKLVIVGKNFGSAAGRVFFDPTGTTPTPVWTDTRIETAVPAPGVFSRLGIQVKVARAEPNAPFVVVAQDFTIDGGATAPEVRKVVNADGTPLVWPLVAGRKVLAVGVQFGTAPGSFFVNGAPMPVSSWSDTEVRFTLAEAAAQRYPGFVTVRRADGGEYSGNFRADGTPPLEPPPLLEGFVDESGVKVVSATEGQILTLRGTGFGAPAGMLIYSGWAVAEVVSWSDTAIRFRVPFAWWDRHVSSVEVFPGRADIPQGLDGWRAVWPTFTVLPPVTVRRPEARRQ